jgi:ERCC4-type nuclease
LVGIEYKKDDFLPCVFDETIDKQLKELKDNFPHHFLFIGYKGIDDMLIQNVGTNPEIITGKLASILARTDTPIMFVGDLLIPFVCKVIERFHDGKNVLKEYTPIRRSATTKEVRLDIISRIPNVGPKKGLKLLEAFGYSISNIAKAEISDLTKVKGVGDIVAKSIKETLK